MNVNEGRPQAKVVRLLTKAPNMHTVFGLLTCVTVFTPCEAVAQSMQGTNGIFFIVTNSYGH